MKIAFGSDQKTNLTDFVVGELKKLGHEVELFGPLAGELLPWPDVGWMVAERVAKEMLESWFSTGVDEIELSNIEKITEIEKKYCFRINL